MTQIQHTRHKEEDYFCSSDIAALVGSNHQVITRRCEKFGLDIDRLRAEISHDWKYPSGKYAANAVPVPAAEAVRLLERFGKKAVNGNRAIIADFLKAHGGAYEIIEAGQKANTNTNTANRANGGLSNEKEYRTSTPSVVRRADSAVEKLKGDLRVQAEKMRQKDLEIERLRVAAEDTDAKYAQLRLFAQENEKAAEQLQRAREDSEDMQTRLLNKLSLQEKDNKQLGEQLTSQISRTDNLQIEIDKLKSQAVSKPESRKNLIDWLTYAIYAAMLPVGKLMKTKPFLLAVFLLICAVLAYHGGEYYARIIGGSRAAGYLVAGIFEGAALVMTLHGYSKVRLAWFAVFSGLILALYLSHYIDAWTDAGILIYAFALPYSQYAFAEKYSEAGKNNS